MNGLPYYKAYPRDFFEGTIGMGFEVKGAYRLILDLIYQHGGRLLDDPRFIAGHLGCSVRKWVSLRSAILESGKIQVFDGCLANYRADKELDTLKTYQEQQREKASKPRKYNGLDVATAKPNTSHTEPDTEEEKREAKASPKKRGSRLADDWFLPKTWGEWAVAEGWKIDAIRTEADNFKDYWCARAGPTAVKLDWEATWRVWMRKTAKTSKPRINSNDQFGAAIHHLADRLSDGTARIDLSDRDPFAVRPRGNPPPNELGAIPLFRSGAGPRDQG